MYSDTTTKERILDVSIDLFSKNGYAETSLRDIARKVGIKASSIYYYFESKEEILDSILGEYKEIIDKHMREHKWHDVKNSISADGKPLSAKEIIEIMFFDFEDYARTLKMLKIICSEEVRNARVRDYRYQMVNADYEFIKEVLDALIDAEKIPKRSSARLATILCSISQAYMHLAAIDVYHIGEDDKGIGMFNPLEYVIKMALEGSDK